MIPRFRLERPTTIEAALEAHARDPDDRAYVAGGTELLQVMKMGLVQVDRLIDLKGIDGLRGIAAAEDAVEIGALTSHRDIERSPLIRERLPELAMLERRVANVRVRSSGTLGGNLAFAEPHSDPATLLSACGALIDLVGVDGTRSMPIDEFIVGPLATSRSLDEIIRAVRVPVASAGETRAYEKIAFHERPTASVAVSTTMRAGRVAEAVIVVGAVTEIPTRLLAAAAGLVGLSHADLDDVLAGWRKDPPDAIEAFDDHTGSADFKRHLTWELVDRAARRAMAAA